MKSTWLDDTLLLNLAVFYDPYSDAQIGVQQFVAPQSNLTAVLNAGKQINRGAELRVGVAAAAQPHARAQHRVSRFVLRGLPLPMQRISRRDWMRARVSSARC